MQLVTGGRGFIGSQLTAALIATGAEVLVLDDGRAAASVEPCPGVRYLNGDIADPATWAQLAGEPIRVAYHLGAHANVAESAKDPTEDFQSNVVGTFNFLQWARQAELQAAVFASSAAIYGSPGHEPIAETNELAPVSPYGATKVAGEAYCRAYQRCYGVPVVIARIFNTYGPGMRQFVLFDFVRKLQADPTRLEILGDGQQVRDYSYITDTVAALRLLAEAGVPGEAYNIASGRPTRIRELADMVMGAMGLQAEVVCSGQSWPGDVDYWHSDISKLQALGF
ncbi:MAG: NAD-dependent epimerase/dehydratase family protein, partial [Bacteroidota bacterium]